MNPSALAFNVVISACVLIRTHVVLLMYSVYCASVRFSCSYAKILSFFELMRVHYILQEP